MYMYACAHTYIYYTNKYTCMDMLYEYVLALVNILYLLCNYGETCGIFSAFIMAFSEVLTSFVRNNGRKKGIFISDCCILCGFQVDTLFSEQSLIISSICP